MLEFSEMAMTRDNHLQVIFTKTQTHAPNLGRVTSVEIFNEMKRQAVGHPEMAP
jgi:hypothetical protein